MFKINLCKISHEVKKDSETLIKSIVNIGKYRGNLLLLTMSDNNIKIYCDFHSIDIPQNSSKQQVVNMIVRKQRKQIVDFIFRHYKKKPKYECIFYLDLQPVTKRTFADALELKLAPPCKKKKPLTATSFHIFEKN